MSEVYITSWMFVFLGFVFHYFEKICKNDYKRAKEEFDVFLKEDNISKWDYNIKKNKMDMSIARKWAAFIVKYICFIASILGFISLIN